MALLIHQGCVCPAAVVAMPTHLPIQAVVPMALVIRLGYVYPVAVEPQTPINPSTQAAAPMVLAIQLGCAPQGAKPLVTCLANINLTHIT
jgi:hypothetical protein